MLAVQTLRKGFRRPGRNAASTAVDGVTFSVNEGCIFTLLGPSGCGKSTILHCIAGIEMADEGRIEIGGKLVFSGEDRKVVPANLRDVGMIFQSYAIWPHMSVYENVAFPLIYGRTRTPAAEVRRRVTEVLDLVKLTELADRPAPNLSGGQQQRVALARALVHRPRLLLLDEPLSNLDAKLRESMRVELRQVINHLGMTTIFVTHDQVEAMMMSDHIALMCAGRIVQQGAPRDIYLGPQTAFAADFMGRNNLVPGLVSHEARIGRRIVETELGPVDACVPDHLHACDEVFIVVRPNSIELVGPGDARGDGNAFTGKVTQISYLGDSVEMEVAVGSLLIRAILSAYAEVKPGQVVSLRVPNGCCVAVPRDADAMAVAVDGRSAAGLGTPVAE